MLAYPSSLFDYSPADKTFRITKTKLQLYSPGMAICYTTSSKEFRSIISIKSDLTGNVVEFVYNRNIQHGNYADADWCFKSVTGLQLILHGKPSKVNFTWNENAGA
jgi:hypothetical protein